MKKPKQKAKPILAWAIVCKDTNEILWLAQPGRSRESTRNMRLSNERLARVEIREI